MSKHELLKHWPIPEFVRDVASFVGFLQFYSKFIPHFEVRVEPLHWIMERDYTKAVGNLWTPAAREHSMTSATPFFATLACVGSTLKG